MAKLAAQSAPGGRGLLAQALHYPIGMVEASVTLMVAILIAVRTMPRTYIYELKLGRLVVYRGMSKDVRRRLDEHRRDGKVFTHHRVIHWSFFRSLARRREVLALAQYRRGHGGANPRYNRRNSG